MSAAICFEHVRFRPFWVYRQLVLYRGFKIYYKMLTRFRVYG